MRDYKGKSKFHQIRMHEAKVLLLVKNNSQGYCLGIYSVLKLNKLYLTAKGEILSETSVIVELVVRSLDYVFALYGKCTMILNEKGKEYVSSFLAFVIFPRELRNLPDIFFEEVIKNVYIMSASLFFFKLW